MASVPVRLSASLANRARQAAAVQERSLTEQVEHWARLGEVVEASVSHATAQRLKTLSHDERLRDRLDAARTAEARARAARLIRTRVGPWFGTAPDDPKVIIRHEANGTCTRGRIVNGKFSALPSRR